MSTTTQRIYDFILWAVLQTGLPPTTKQIAAGVGLKSTCSVHRQVKKLEMMKMVKIVNRHPIPCSVLEYLELFNPTQIQVKESV